MKKWLGRFGAGIVAITLSAAMLSASALPASGTDDPSELRMRDKYTNNPGKGETETVNNLPYYAQLKDIYSKYPLYAGEKLIYTSDAISGSENPVEGFITEVGTPSRRAFVWDESVMWIEWTVDIPKTALYNLEIGYHAHDVSTLDAVRELYIDGEIPYRELSNIALKWNWRDEGEPIINDVGDEVIPSQELVEKWNDAAVYDQEGYYPEPLRILFEKGRHTIRLTYVQQPAAISHIALTAPAVLPDYAQILAEYRAKGYTDAKKSVFFEAESAVTDKNSPNLSRVPNYDPRTSPNVSGYKRLNTMGDNYWSRGGQSITWSFTVPESGLYRIDMRALASYTNGLPVYRQIKVDGEVPFSELLEYRFDYGKDWRIETLSDESGKPYLFYFEAGCVHTLTMTVVLSAYSELILSLNDDAQLFADYLLKVTMLVGTSPDVNYEYEITRNIPETEQVLSELIKSLSWKVDFLSALAGGKSVPAANSLQQSLSLLRQVLSDPESIPKQLGSLTENQGLLTIWYTNLQSMPLALDYFELKPEGAPVTDAVSRWYEKAWATLRTFMVSFVKDYNSIGVQTGGDEADVISVWVSMSTEAAEILRGLIDDSFTKKTGIRVNLNLLPAGQLNAGAVNSLMLSIVSGNAPDVAVSVGASTPVELAIRDAALELSSMEGFDEFAAEFLPETFVPLTFNNKIYGVPERMDFRLMFYRKDILAELGLSVPDTWDEFYATTLQVLKQNQLEAYIPQDINMFLFQRKGRYYTDDGLRSAFDTVEGYAAFEEMVRLYTNYGIPLTTAFFSRFRIGSIPVGIGGYVDYISLLTGAPELAGKWGVALIPGHADNDGGVNRSWSGSTTSASMALGFTKHPDKCWAFLEWWMGSETQSRYAREIEARIGLGSRVNTANTVAFRDLAWRLGDLSVITESWESIVETPGVLGGPYTARHVNNAWNRIIIDKQNITPRDSFEEAIEEINKELEAKQEEYPHLVTGGNIYD